MIYLDSRTSTGVSKLMPLAAISTNFIPSHWLVSSDCCVVTLIFGQSLLRSSSEIDCPVVEILSNCACAAAMHCCLNSWKRLNFAVPAAVMDRAVRQLDKALSEF